MGKLLDLFLQLAVLPLIGIATYHHISGDIGNATLYVSMATLCLVMSSK
jgi:hypothetical protein